MLRDRGVSRIRQSQLLKSDAPLAHGHLVTGYLRKEPFHQRALHVLAGKLGLDSATNELAPFAEQRDILLLRLWMLEQILFCRAALMPQALKLVGVDAMPF